jgi:hypothetical protein
MTEKKEEELKKLAEEEEEFESIADILDRWGKQKEAKQRVKLAELG